MNVCAVDGCPRPVESSPSGWCGHTHYMHRTGIGTSHAPTNAKHPRHVPFEQWFWSYLPAKRRVSTGCAAPVMSVWGDGCGRHMLSPGLTNGPIPGGLHVLHSCDRPICGNPAPPVPRNEQRQHPRQGEQGTVARGNPEEGCTRALLHVRPTMQPPGCCRSSGPAPSPRPRGGASGFFAASRVGAAVVQGLDGDRPARGSAPRRP